MFAALVDTLLEKTILLVVATIVSTYGAYVFALKHGWQQKMVWKYSWLIFLIPFALLFAVILLPFPFSFIGLLLFWAIFGVWLVLILPRYSEETVRNALSLTWLITLIVGYFGFTTMNDLSFLGPILFIALIGLIVWNLVVLWRRSEGKTGRMLRAVFGALIFTIYIVYDMNRLAEVSNYTGSDGSWQLATQFAIDIYLDMINLFLYILQLMDK